MLVDALPEDILVAILMAKDISLPLLPTSTITLRCEEDPVLDAWSCIRAAHTCSVFAAAWRRVSIIDICEPDDHSKVLVVHADALRHWVDTHKVRRLEFSGPFPFATQFSRTTFSPYTSRIAFLGAWSTIYGCPSLRILTFGGCLALAPPASLGLEGPGVNHHYASPLIAAILAGLLPQLTELHAGDVGPRSVNALIEAISRTEISELSLACHPGFHPGESPHFMSRYELEHRFAPEGVAFWAPHAHRDIVEEAQRAVVPPPPFSQPRLHASLQHLDLASPVPWPAMLQVGLIANLHRLAALETLNLSFGFHGSLELLAALAKVPTLVDFHLEGVALLPITLPLGDWPMLFMATSHATPEPHDAPLPGWEGVETWAAAFAALAALPRLRVLNLLDVDFEVETAMELAQELEPATRVAVACKLFEMPAGDAPARAREKKAVEKKWNRLRRLRAQLAD